MENNTFDSASSALLPGVNLLEASAGTGKTYTIAMLVTRFVVEQGLDIDKLLVVTFTRAATEELKTRIRGRLNAALKALTQQAQHSDNNVDQTLQQWLQTLGIDAELARQRLRKALLEIDRAGIFTIHGFCQRILAEHALESGQLFDTELSHDLSEIRQACADDFWRQQVYLRSPTAAALLTTDYDTPDKLLASITGLSMIAKIYPQQTDIDEQLQRCIAQMHAARACIDEVAESVQQHFAEQTFKKAMLIILSKPLSGSAYGYKATQIYCLVPMYLRC